MKLILKRDVENLGGAGDIVDVADGYGNNYLLPRGLAMRATRGAVKDAEAIRGARRKREAQNRAQAEGQRELLESRPLRIAEKARDDGTLYGSVSSRDVVAALRDQLGVTIDRRRVRIQPPFKHVGSYEVEVPIRDEVTATVSVEVVPAET